MQDLEARDLVLNAVCRHRHDKDGGYDLRESLQHLFQASGSQEEKDQIALAMLRVAMDQEEGWGAILEALGRESAQSVGQELAHLLSDEGCSSELRDEVCRALLWMKYQLARERCRDYIVSQLRQGRDSALPLLAMLSLMDPDECVSLSVSYMLGRLCREKGILDFRGCLPCFLSWFVKADAHLAASLIRSARRLDEEVASDLKRYILEYLSGTFVLEELGESAVETLRCQLAEL